MLYLTIFIAFYVNAIPSFFEERYNTCCFHIDYEDDDAYRLSIFFEVLYKMLKCLSKGPNFIQNTKPLN